MKYEYSTMNLNKDSRTNQVKENKEVPKKEKKLSTENLLLEIISRLDKLEVQHEAKLELANSSLANRS